MPEMGLYKTASEITDDIAVTVSRRRGPWVDSSKCVFGKAGSY